MHKSKRPFGTGQNVIPFAVGEIITCSLLGFAYAMTRVGREIKQVRDHFSNLPSNPSEEELTQWEDTARQKGWESNFWQPAVVDCGGTVVLLADAGFTPEPKQFEVVEVIVEGYAQPLKRLEPVKVSQPIAKKTAPVGA